MDEKETIDFNKNIKFDIYISFESKLESSIAELYKQLINFYDLNVYVDSRSLRVKQKYYAKSGNAIIRSRMLICCVNRDYLRSRKCTNELILAYMTMKPILVIFMEELKRAEYETLMFALENATRYQLYETKWTDRLVMYLLNLIQSLLKRKITTRGVNPKTLVDFEMSDEEEDDEEEEESNKIEEKRDKVEEKATSNSLAQTSLSVLQYVQEEDDATIIADQKYNNFRLVKKNQTFEFAYGYNRMAYMASQQRYLITSSYNKTIITIGNGANWIERRNPCNLLAQPYSICVNRFSEIYIGDNELKCIFVFDKHFKHTRTFAEGLLNGYSDMQIDLVNNNDLYTVSMYDSLLSIIDIAEDGIIDKTYISSPTYIRLFQKKIYVATYEDVICILDKASLSVDMKIEFDNCKLMSCLYVYDENLIFTTVNKVFKCFEKTREKYLAIVKLDAESGEPSIKYLNMNTEQINDMYMLDDHLMCISDTDVNIFCYKDITRF